MLSKKILNISRGIAKMVHNSCLQVLVKPLILAEILWLDGSVSASGKAELMSCGEVSLDLQGHNQ